jgi:hypothetical protein
LLLIGASLSTLIPLIHTPFALYPVDNDYWQMMLREGMLTRLLPEQLLQSPPKQLGLFVEINK